VASFTAGVFAVYLAGGLVLVLGPGPALIAALRHLGPTLEHALEVGAGAALLIVTAVFWLWRRKRSSEAAQEAPRSARLPLALGAGITALELPTAFMYFGAISAVIASGAGIPVRVLLVFVYSAVFVLPLLAIAAVCLLLREGGAARLRAADVWLRRVAPVAVTAIAGVAGALLVSIGVDGMAST
jgi:cytochrome c biogenesis protein CcdA